MLATHRNARRLGVAAFVVLLLGLVAVASTPELGGARVLHVFEGIGRADPRWLWLAGLCFLLSLAGSAGSWWTSVRLCGARLSLLDANGRYGIGSLVNTFVPARAGDAARIALFSRSLDGDARLWATGGAFAAIGAARSLVLAVLVGVGVAVGALPLWPLAVLIVLVLSAVGIAWRSRGRRARSHAAHVLDAFRALGRDPLAGLRIAAWITLATLGRIGAAAAVAAALGVRSPLAAAIVIVPALDVAGILPVTPGNLGVASGAVAMALQAHGIGLSQALTTGIAFHAVETIVSLLYGTTGAVLVAGESFGRARRVLALTAGAAACLALVLGLGTAFTDLV
jgi:uncharacterized membrane protein YbhN (UPF0104 family)